MADQVVDRLLDILVERLRERPDPTAPVRVSHVYDDLVPYADVRGRLGVEVKADYEHALLRLFAGERDLLHLEPEAAREALRREVESPYPAVDLYRRFSNSRASVSLPADGAVDAADPEPGTTGAQDTAGAQESVSEREAPAPDEAAHEPADGPADGPAGHGSMAGVGSCGFCGRDLPAGRDVRYCPFCGGDQRLEPCPECGTALEPDWRYCIGCGRETDS